MNKFLFTADFHIENNKNLDNVKETVEWIVNLCLERGIKNAVILGDFLNSRDKIDSLALNTAVDILDKFNEHGIKVYLLLGNHEKYNKSVDFRVNSIKVFKKHAKVVDKFKVIEFDTYNFILVPYIDEKDIFESIVNKVSASLNKDKKNILLLHQPIFGAIVNDASNTRDYGNCSPFLFSNFNYVFSGHYHTYQTFDNVTYVGSPVQLNHGEESGQKGVTIVDFDQNNSIEFVVNPKYQKYVTTSDTNCNVEGKFVRFYADNTKSSDEINEVIKKFIAAGAKDVKVETVKSDAIDFEMIKNKFDLAELVKKWIDINKNDLDAERLFEIGNKIRKNVKEKLHDHQ